MIGNDIVDLASVGSPAYSHVEHLTRVCTVTEAAVVRTSPDPPRKLAEIWASKEAAFKLLSKNDSSLSFVPRRFEVHLGHNITVNCMSNSYVGRGNAKVHVSLFATTRWVHAVAISDARHAIRWLVTAFNSRAFSCDTPSAETQAARLLGKQLLAEHCSPEMRLEFTRRIPVVRSEGRSQSGVDISLSHHGSFVAAAIAWPATELPSSPEIDERILQDIAREGAWCTCTA